MARFSPPARIDDFQKSAKADELAAGWHAVVDHWVTTAAQSSDGRFHNLNAAGAPSGGAEAPIPWDAFPLVIKRWFETEIGGDEKKYRAADALRPILFNGRPLRAARGGKVEEELEVFHRQQDEYCEWFVERSGSGRITGIQFTCEGPEYFEFLVKGTAALLPEDNPDRDLTKGDPALALQLYHDYVSRDVKDTDLVWQHDVAAWDGEKWVLFAQQGEYNKLNKWNTTHGAMHLTHPSNTLGAEVNLAADASVLRDIDDPTPQSLICCAGYGGVNRSSDPLIGFGVNAAAAAGKTVSLADPVGLYISDFNRSALSDPNAWSVKRADASGKRILRARIDVPDGGLQVGGAPLKWGGQVAELIQMILFGWVADAQDDPPVRACRTKCCTHPERPEFKEAIDPGESCSTVHWAGRAPFLPPDPGEPQPAGAPMPGLTDSDAGAEVSSERIALPTGR